MEWVRGERIGYGSFATVSLAKSVSQDSNFPPLMAVKSCPATHSASLERERLILDEFRGDPHIVSCYGDGFSFENGDKLYNLYLEYASGGSLTGRIKKSKISEYEIRNYACLILKGLKSIHEKGYVHCDIKLDNILLFDQNNVVKIADFGLANKAAEKCEIRGTPMYMSPEMAAGVEQQSPADIWALGCVVLEMFTGAPAWRCSNIGALSMKIGSGGKTPEIPAIISEEGKDFLAKCFVRNPKERWTAEKLLRHTFLDGHDFVTVPLKEIVKEDQSPSTSPKCAFDFPDWESKSITTLPSAENSSSELNSWSKSNSASNRIRQLITKEKSDWSKSGSWIKVR